MNSKHNPDLHRPSLQKIKEVDDYPPYVVLRDKLSSLTNDKSTTSVCHWFRHKDLRVEDNVALYHAAQKAKKANKLLTTLYLYCPQSLIEHGISKARFDFLLESLKTLKSDLEQLNIPLVILEIQQLSDTNKTLIDWCKKLSISDLYANYEYEVNELRRDIQVVEGLGKELNCYYYHDQCVIEPGTLRNEQAKPFQVYTYYLNKWIECIKQSPSLTKTCPKIERHTFDVRKQANLFEYAIPKPPKEKRFDSSEEQLRLRKLWPVGHAAALKKLDYFMKHHLRDYTETRSMPALDSTSRLSPYIAIGAIGLRTLLEKLAKSNSNIYDFSAAASGSGIFGWVRELVFREFHRHQLVITPHLSMNTPQNLKFTRVEWEKDELGWRKWCNGTTGMPFIDAGMRQLKQEAYMHNRLRMNVASYLYNTLLIDYRRGERYFADMLIDWDLANNVLGWSPSYTVFNPVLQAEKNDSRGDYIRKWVPELKDVKGKAVFDPSQRLSEEEFKKLGYPKPHVEWKISKDRARTRFKAALNSLKDRP